MITTTLLAAIAIGLVIGLIVLLALQVMMGLRVQRLTAPLYEYARSQSQAEADRILNDAREQARKIVSDAESGATALIDTQRSDIESRAHAYVQALEAFASSAQHSLDENAARARDAHEALVKKTAQDIESQSADIKARLAQMQQMLEKFAQGNESRSAEISAALDKSAREALEKMDRALEDVTAAGTKRIDERIDALLKAAENDVSAYNEARKRLIDEHMADLVSETSKIVLQKALSADEHAELVQRALQEAHATGLL